MAILGLLVIAVAICVLDQCTVFLADALDDTCQHLNIKEPSGPDGNPPLILPNFLALGDSSFNHIAGLKTEVFLLTG